MLFDVTAGLLSPVFVGRAGELARLARAFDATPSTALIVGEAGVGKSRLVREFVTSIGNRALAFTGGTDEMEGLAYAPFTGALRGLVQQVGTDRIVGLLPRGTAGELARLIPELRRPDAQADPEIHGNPVASKFADRPRPSQIAGRTSSSTRNASSAGGSTTPSAGPNARHVEQDSRTE
jgi:hypothetical protein